MTICSCHVTYAFQSGSALYSCLNVKELLAQSRHKIWSLSDCYWTTECGFSLKCIRDMTRTYNHLHWADMYSQHSSIIWPVWLIGWVFVYELSGCGFASSSSHLVIDIVLTSMDYGNFLYIDGVLVHIFTGRQSIYILQRSVGIHVFNMECCTLSLLWQIIIWFLVSKNVIDTAHQWFL